QKFNTFKNSLNSDIDANLMPINNCSMSYNFNFENGALRDGMGLKQLQFRCSELYTDQYKVLNPTPDSSFIKGCWFFTSWSTDLNIHRPFVIFYTSKGGFYYNRIHSQDKNLEKMNGLEFTERPIVTSCKINGNDTLILVSEKDGMYTWRYPGIVQKIENAPKISSMCVHNDRLFVTTQGEKRTIMFSDNLDPTNFNVSIQEGGIIELADEFGKSNKVISFEGYVYIFRDFNIAKLTTYADKNDFSVSQLYVSNGRIYESTVCVCGNKILYLSSDGIYVFNGTSATKFDLSINNLFKDMDNANALAGYSNGYYYLACTINYGDDKFIGNETNTDLVYNNALIKINVATGSFSILRGYDVRQISVVNDIYKSEVCILIKENTGGYSIGVLDDSGKIFNTPTTKLWKSATTDFGYPEKEKVVKEISLETTGDITLEIVTEKGSRNFKMKGKSGYQTLRPYVKGKKIGINFKSNIAGNYISNPKITVGYL
ncbi:MAG: hypothetical protein ACI4PF_03280, partial [Christensenellales bacterium]